MHAGHLTAVALVVSCAAACTSSDDDTRGGGADLWASVGVIANGDIREASGLARSLRYEDRLWVINDSGSPAVLHAIGEDGSDLGSVTVENARNVDWEDLASFELDGEPQLLIADIGDNAGKRDAVTLYIVPEPDPAADSTVAGTRRVSFRYPGGPRDAESAAVHDGVAYIVTKRTLPAELYAVPLTTDSAVRDEVVTASYLGPLSGLPLPTMDDLRQAVAFRTWDWQPTAMDVSRDGRLLAVLTYGAAYAFERRDDGSWHDALRTEPYTIPLGGIRNAESMCLADAALFVTVEGRDPPLYRSPLPPRQD